MNHTKAYYLNLLNYEAFLVQMVEGLNDLGHNDTAKWLEDEKNQIKQQRLQMKEAIAV